MCVHLCKMYIYTFVYCKNFSICCEQFFKSGTDLSPPSPPHLLKLNDSDIIFLKYNYILTKPLLLDI